MDTLWLREHVARLREGLVRFEQIHEQLHVFYRRAYPHAQNQAALSTLMETYFIHLDRQQRILAQMTTLYQKANDQLIALESERP